jgi:outer membrane protein OmpA-like peptidoglycan-associated protein
MRKSSVDASLLMAQGVYIPRKECIMFCKLLMTGLCVAAAVMYFDWTGPFHWWVGLFVLGVVTLVSVLLHKRLQADGDGMDEIMMDEEEDDASVGHSLVMGLVRGVATVGVLALAFVGLSSTPLRAWIEGPDCRAMLAEIDILTTGQAHDRIVQVVDLAEERPLGPACRQDLRTRKVRALLAQAEHIPNQRLALLQQAQVVAVADADLQQVVASRLEAETARLESEQDKKAHAERVAAVRQEKDELQARNQELEAAIDTLKALRDTLLGERFTVEDTDDGGIKVILREEDALHFASNEATLDEKGYETVRRLATLINQPAYRSKRVRVVGHTDATGHHHDALSLKRAQSVVLALIEHGIDSYRLQTEGMGDRKPVASNKTPEGRAQNRRVELIILNDESSGEEQSLSRAHTAP